MATGCVYLLGVTDVNEKNWREVTFETLEENQAEASRKEPAKLLKKVRLFANLQAAKRWGPVVARFGLFESSGGVAMDIFALQDRFKIFFRNL